MPHDQHPIGDLHGDRQLLLDQQHRNPPLLQLSQVLTHQFDDLGRQAFGRLVDDDEIGIAHQGAAQGQHLLLAARQHAGFGVLALLQAREHGVHVVKAPAAALARTLLPQQQVLLHRQGRKDVAAFRHVAQPQVGDLERLAAEQRVLLEAHRALCLHHPHDGLGGGRAARAIAPQQRHDFAGLDVELHAMQHMALAVIGVKVAHAQHRQCPCSCCCATTEPR